MLPPVRLATYRIQTPDIPLFDCVATVAVALLRVSDVIAPSYRQPDAIAVFPAVKLLGMVIVTSPLPDVRIFPEVWTSVAAIYFFPSDATPRVRSPQILKSVVTA